MELADFIMSQWVRSFHTTTGQQVFEGITLLGECGVLFWTSLGLILILLPLRRFRSALLLVALGLFCLLLSLGAKELVQRDRPASAKKQDANGYSYPSGHCVGVAGIYGFMGLVLARSVRRRLWACLVVAGTMLLILAVGFSRVYLGVHYPSDVIGGLAAGLALAFTGLWLEMRLGRWTAAKPAKEESFEPELVADADLEAPPSKTIMSGQDADLRIAPGKSMRPS